MNTTSDESFRLERLDGQMGYAQKVGAVLAAGAAFVFAAPASAAVVACSGGAVDLTVDQCTWPNAGPPGANDSLAEVQAAIAAATGVNVDLVLYGKSDDPNAATKFTFSFSDFAQPGVKSADWSVIDGTLINYVTIKGANDFKVYQLPGAGASSGTGYSTLGILNNGGRQPNISHLSFWTVPVSAPAVPEPATWAMMILGFGLVGGALRRRRRESANLSFA